MRITRRNVVAAGGLGMFAAAMAGLAEAADTGSGVGLPAAPTVGSTADPSHIPSVASASSIEKTNIQLVKDFCKAWGDDPPDVQAMVNQYLSDDCVVRFGETIDPVHGRDDAAALFQSFLSNGERYDLKILETFARGPIVVNSRIDSTIKGKHTTHPTDVVGVFVIRDGKIKEWSDYT